MADDGPRLVVQNTVLKGRVYPLKPEGVTIGRGVENGIFVDLPSVSRQHARVEKVGDDYRVRDLGSRNGIRVNDEPAQEAVLKPGQIFAVGDVLFMFQTEDAVPAQVEPHSPTQAIPEAAPAVVEAGIPMAPREPEGEVRRGVLLMAVFMGCLAVIVAAGGYLAVTKGKFVPARLALAPVKVAVNESKLVYLQNASILSSSISSSDAHVARAERYEELYLLVTGLSGGATTIRMETERGNVVTLRVLVRGRIDDPLDSYRRMQLSEEQRRTQAARFVAAGDRLSKTEKSKAIEQYRIALVLMRPVPDKGSMVVHATAQVQKLEREVQEEYRELIASVQTVLQKDHDENAVSSAIFYLQEAMDLVPDKQDPRHQRAYLKIKDLLAKTSGERKRR